MTDKNEGKTYWARVRIYRPFIMGGDVWPWCRYEVKEPNIEEQTICRVKTFIFFDTSTNMWKVHELTTGGFVAEHPTKERALGRAEYDIKRTPDFKKQIKTLGPVMDLQEHDADDAVRRLAKSDRVDPDAEDLKAMRVERHLEL